MKKKYRYQDENGQWVKGFYDEKEIEDLKQYGFQPEEVTEYYNPNDEDKDNPYYDISESELTDFMQAYPQAMLKSDYESQLKKKEQEERGRRKSQQEYERSKKNTTLQSNINQISLNQADITSLVVQSKQPGVSDQQRAQIKSQVNALTQQNKELLESIKGYDREAYDYGIAAQDQTNMYYDEPWDANYSQNFWNGYERDLNQRLKRVQENAGIKGETIASDYTKRSEANRGLSELDKIREQMVNLVSEIKQKSQGGMDGESIKSLYGNKFENLLLQAETYASKFNDVLDKEDKWRSNQVVDSLKWYKDQAFNQASGGKNFDYIIQSGKDPNDYYNAVRKELDKKTGIIKGQTKTSEVQPTGLDINISDIGAYRLNSGSRFKSLTAEDLRGYTPEDVAATNAAMEAAGGKPGDIGYDANKALIAAGKNKRGVGANKVVRAAVDDYFDYYAKVNPEMAKIQKAQYDAYSKSTDLNAYQQGEKLKFENKAVEYATKALAMDLDRQKNVIDVLNDGMQGIDFQTFSSGIASISKREKEIKSQIDAINQKIEPIVTEFENHKASVENEMNRLNELYKQGGVDKGVYESLFNDLQNSLTQKQNDLNQKVKEITGGVDYQSEIDKLNKEKSDLAIKTGVNEDVYKLSEQAAVEYQKYEDVRSKLGNLEYLMQGWDDQYPDYKKELEQNKKLAEFRALEGESELGKAMEEAPFWKKALYYGYKYLTPVGLLKETEIGRGFSNAVGSGIVGIAQAPEVFYRTFGGDSYGWTSNLYDWVQDVNFVRQGEFGDYSAYGYEKSAIDKYTYLGGNVVGSLTLFAAGGSLGGATKTGQIASTFTTSYFTSLGDTYNDMLEVAKENNMSPQWAAGQAQALTIALSAVECMIPDIKYFEPSAARKSILAAIRSGKTINEAFKGVLDAIPDAGKAYLKSSTKEGFEEWASTIAKDLYQSSYNVLSGTQYFNDTWNPSEHLESIIGGVIGGVTGNFFSRPQGATTDIKAMMYEAAENGQSIIDNAKNESQKKKLESDLKGAMESFGQLSSHANWEILHKEDRIEAFFLSQQINDLQNKVNENKKNGIEDKATEQKLSEYQTGLNTILNSITADQAKGYQEHKNNVNSIITNLATEADYGVIENSSAYQGLNDSSKKAIDEIRKNILEAAKDIDETGSDKAKNEYSILQDEAKQIMSNPSSYKNGDYPWRIVEDTDNEVPMLEDKRGQYVSSRFKDFISEDVKGDEARKMAAEEWLGTEDGKRYSLLTQNKDDQKNKQGLPSEEQQGKEPVQAKSVQGAGTEETPAGGVVQGTQEEVTTEVAPEAELKTKEKKSIKIQPIDFEFESEDIDIYEASNSAEKIAKDNGVNILRGKEIKSVATDDNNNVVGGLWTEISGDEFSFDVAVDKESQGQGVGEKLVNDAISEFNAQNYDGNLKYKVDVTNPIMEKLLSKYGFQVVERIGSHTIMEHPTNDPKLSEKKATAETETKIQDTTQTTEQVEEKTEEQSIDDLFNPSASFTSRVQFMSPEILMAKFGMTANQADAVMGQMQEQGIVSEPDSKGQSDVLMKPYQVAQLLDAKRVQARQAQEEKAQKEKEAQEMAEMTPEQIEYENKVNGLKGDIARMDPTLNDSAVDTAARLFANGLTAKEAISKAKAEQKQQTRKERKEAAAASRVTLPKRGTPKGKPVSMSDAIGRLGQALKSSGIDIQVAETQEEYDRLAQEQGIRGGNTEGFFVSKGENPRIVFNKKDLEGKYGKVLLFHEGTHPIVNIIRNTNPKVYKKLVSGLNTLAKKNKSLNKVRNEIKKAVSPESFEDEFIVESLAQIASGNIDPTKLDRGLRSALINFMNDIAKYLGLGQIPINASTDEFLKLANQIKDAFEGGRDISEIVGEENVDKYQLSVLSDEAQELIVPGSQILGTNNIAQASIANSRIDDFDTSSPKVVGVKMKYPKQKQSIEEVLKKSGGAAVFVNSDGTKVGKVTINGKNYTVQGGLDYTFIDKNYKENVGFAASEDQKIRTLNNIAKQTAELRDAKDSTHKGKPVAVFVVSQNGEAMLGEWYAGEYIMEGIDKALNEGLYEGGVEAAKNDLIDALKSLKITEVTGKTKQKTEDSKSRDRLIEMIENGVKINGKLYSFDSHKCRMEIADFLSSKEVSFGFRTKLNGEIIAANANKFNSGKNRRMKKALANAGHHMEDFWKKFADERFLPSVKAEKSIPKKGKVFANKTFSGFYYDPFVSMEEQINHTQKGISHRQFNSKFKSTGDPFLLENAHDVNKLFPDMGYADKNGYKIYNKANKTNFGKDSSLEDRLAVSKWLNENGYSKKVVNPYSSISLSIYTGYITDEVQPSTKIDREIDEYIDDLQKTKDADPEKYWSVDVPPASDVKSGTFIKDADGAAFVDENGDVRGLYKFPSSEQKGVGDRIVKKAIAAGGIKLDNFDIYLSNIYLKNGFKIASRIPFNPELAPKGYVREKGATKDPDVVFMVYDPYGKLGIEDKMFDDYGDALEYRESFIPKQQEVYGNTLDTKDVRNEKIVEGEPMSRRPMMDMGLPASEVNVRNIGSIKNVLWASEIDSKGEVSRPADLISNMGGGKNEAYVYAIYNNQELSPRNTEEIISELYNLYEADLNKKLYKATDVEAIKILNDKINDEGYTEALNRYFDNIKDKNEFIEFKTVKEETDFIYGLFSMTAEYMSFSGMTKSNVGSGTVRILGRSGSDISGGVKITPEMIETLKEAKENGTEVEVLKELLQITDENPYIHVSSLSPKDYADKNSIPYESKESEQEGAQPSTKIDREAIEAKPSSSIDQEQTEAQPRTKINWEESPEGKGDPSISSRNPIVTKAAQDLREGKITNEEYRATVSENSPILPITRFFKPATLQQIRNAFAVSTKKESQAEKIEAPVSDGTIVGLRLDIPCYKFNNTWVVSVHDGPTPNGPVISYTNVGKIKNVRFSVSPYGAMNIATGKEKNSIARMYGEWENIPGSNMEEKGQSAMDMIDEIANDPSYVQVGMNPFRHSYFYDRSSDIGRPIMNAEEVIQIGGLVYAKNPVYGNWTDEAFQIKDMLDASGKSVQFSSTIDRDQSDKQNEIDNQFLRSNGVTELDVNRWLSDNKYNNLLDPKAREQFNKDFGLTLPPLQDIMNTDQLDTAIQSGIDDMGADLDNGVPYSQAFEKNIKSKPWYNLLTQNQKNELSNETETIYAEEYSQEAGEQQVANITPVEKASKLVELYYKKKDNQRGASVEEKRILESDEKLKYIWQNIPSILRQLENNGILTKTTGCP